MDIKIIYYIAGLLEGEGCFDYKDCPRIILGMKDEDTIVKARTLLKSDNKIEIRNPTKPNHNTIYRIVISGNLAVQWMMTLYPLMSRRRKEKIRELLIKWKLQKSRDRGVDYCINGHPLLIQDVDYYLRNEDSNSSKRCKICHKEYYKEYRKPNNELTRAFAKINNITIEEAESILQEKFTIQ